MKTPLDTQLNPTTPPAAMDASSIARSVLLAREALDFGAEHLSHDITERLRAARVRALTAPAQKTTPAKPAKQSSFNFGQWFNHLSGWLRGAIAASTVAIAFVLTFGTTQSDLNNLPTQANVVASTQPETVMGALPAVPTGHALVSNTVATVQGKAKHADTGTSSTARSAPQASAPLSTVASVSTNADDEQVDIILREKIPLQAYLNDEFNQYANGQGIHSTEPTSKHTTQTQSH